MKIKIESLVELTVEVPEKSDTDNIVMEAKSMLRSKFKNRKPITSAGSDLTDHFKIIIIGKE